MREYEFRYWLTNNRGYSGRTVSSRVSNCRTVERYEGDLDRHFEDDKLREVIRRLTYTSRDQIEKSPMAHKIPIDGNIYTGSATLKSAVSLYKQFREEPTRISERSSTSKPFASSSYASRNENAGIVSASQLADWRRKLVALLVVLEQTNSSAPGLGVGQRIAQLQRSGIIPREVGAMMRTISEMRNATEYEAKKLSDAESSVVKAAWMALQEWASARGIDSLR